MVYRIFVEKKAGLDNEAKCLLNEAKNLLSIENKDDIPIITLPTALYINIDK